MKKILLLSIIFCAVLLNAEWTVVQTFSIPEGASGLAFDGTYLYCGIYGANGDEVYRIDPEDGSYLLQFSNAAIGDSFGMTWDGSNLWITDHVTSPSVPASAIELDINSGAILSEFDLPAHYMSGIAHDNGDFWVAAYYDPDGEIYKVDNTGNILQQFTAPDQQPWDLCLENDNLWMADYWGDTLYCLDPVTGTLIDSYASEGVDPAGIVYDGQYLWYCDNGAGGFDYLYKVDLGGTGAPVIQLGWEDYDFGNTTIGSPTSVELPVSNTGIADLSISELNFSITDFYSDETLPFTVLPGETENLTIFFEPSSWGAYESMLEIISNDPVHPSEEITLSGYGLNDGPHIVLSQTSINYGLVRVNAVTGNYIQVTNQGDEVLEISEIEFEEAQFFISDNIELPLFIDPAENYDLRIWFQPEEAIIYNSTSIIHSNDAITPMVTLDLTGTGDGSAYPIGQELWQFQIDTGYDNSPKAMAPISDINGDGIDDIIICSEDNYVRCFNGNSSGIADIIWEFEITSGNIYSQNGLTITDDMDEDEYKDIVVGTTGGDRSIYTISGRSGEIIWTYNTSVYGSGGWVYQVDSSYDFNSDEILDVLAATGNDGTGTGPQRVFCLDGISGAVIWDFYVSGPKFSCIGISDITNDGIPDAIGGGSNSGETEGKVWGIDGSDGSQLWEFTTGGSSVWALAEVDDFSGNAINDVVAGDFGGNYYGIDSYNGVVEWNGAIGLGLIIRFEKLSDVNGDDHPDIAIARSSQDNAIVIDGYNGNNIWLQPVADQPWVVDKIGDITGDGINDVVWGTLFGSNFGYFLDGSSGEILSQTPAPSAVDAISGIPDIANDGSWEMVLGARDGTVKCISGGEVASSSPNNTIDVPELTAELLGNFPNPFNPETSINFIVKKESRVTLKIYNIKGQLIKTLIDQNLSPSNYNVIWDGKNDNNKTVSSGIYFYNLKADNYISSKKSILLK